MVLSLITFPLLVTNDRENVSKEKVEKVVGAVAGLKFTFTR